MSKEKAIFAAKKSPNMAQASSILSSTYDVTAKFVASIPKADRKKYGQFLTYIDEINELLVPRITEPVKVIDLFAGCGGLSLGFEASGFETIGYEMVSSAVETYNRNMKGHCYERMLKVGEEYPKADIIIGGPPCQPFSVRGKQQGMNDARDGFPIFIDAVKRLQPKVFMFENVRNLAFSHKWYLDLIIDELRKLNSSVEYRCLKFVH